MAAALIRGEHLRTRCLAQTRSEREKMFRKKASDASETAGPAPVPAPVQRLEPAVEEEPKPPVRRATAIPARPLNNPGFAVDAGRRTTTEASPPPPVAASVRDKCLLIGKQVTLKGEVPACEKVIVEGEAELQLSGCRSLQVGTLGVFRGRAEVAEADIAGLFEGEIVARERLSVRSTARMSGKISYGQIIIEAGGRVSGEIIGLQPAAGTTAPAAAETRPQPEDAAAAEGEVAAAPAEAEVPASVRLSFAADDRP